MCLKAACHLLCVVCLVLIINIDARQLSACHLEADDNPRFFRQRVGMTLMRRPCAMGTLFSPHTCSCSKFDAAFWKFNYTLNETWSAPNGECKPYFSLPFKHDLRAEHVRVGVGNHGVELLPAPGASDGKAAFFDSASFLKIWALNDMDFGDSFVLSLRFKMHPSRLQGDYGSFALVDNSGCGRNATLGVAVGVNKSGMRVYGGFILKRGHALSRDIPIDNSNQKDWHNVVLLKDGDRFVLQVDDRAVVAMVPGRIKRQSCELRIGEGWGLRNFKGFIDDVEFFKCVPPNLRD